MASSQSSRVYELSSRVLLSLLAVPGVRDALSWFSKVWLRQARLVKHLDGAAYDGIVDGGASIGEFAALARLARPGTPILCVEPHPHSAHVLRRRGFAVIEAALWDQAGTARLTQPLDATTSCTITGEASTDRPSWDVPTLRLDSLPMTGNNLLIKLDLQGAELQALAGLGTMWSRCAGFLLEVSYGPNGTYEPLRALLASHGFYEAATFNELDSAAGPIEADKLWLPRGTSSA